MKSTNMKTPPAQAAAAAEPPRGSRPMRWIVGALASIHLGIALTMMANHVGTQTIAAGSDAWHMHYFWQFSQGGHSYYARGDVEHVTDGYTPLASEIFGWTIRAFGPDIRWARLVAALFGLAGMALTGACVKRATGDWFFAYVAGALAAGAEMKWYIDVGPNTVHATFSVLAVYLFLRDPGLGWKTLAGAGLALFASFWSKQLGLAYMVAGTVYVASKDWKKGLWFGGGLAALSAGAIAYYQSLEGSNFLYWVFEMNRQQPIIWSRLWTVFFGTLATKKFAVAAVFVVAGLLAFERSWRGLFRADLLMLGAAGVAGAYANNKYGSGTSQLWTFYLLALAVGVGYAHRFLKEKQIAVPLLGTLLGMQSLALVEDPRPYYVNAEDDARYAQIMGVLSAPGKTSYFINRGFMSHLAGGKAWPQAGEDSWNRGRFDQNMLSRERRAFLEGDPWDVVIIDVPLEDNSYALYDRLEKAYRPLYEIPASAKYPTAYDLRYKKIVFGRKPLGT